MIDEIIKEVSGWENVSAAPHRFGGTEFRYGKPEIGHIHRNGLTDIPFPMKVRDELIKEKIVYPHHIMPESGWISFYVRKKEDVKIALKLFRLSYLRYAIRRDKNGSGYMDEVDKMDLPESIKNIYKQLF